MDRADRGVLMVAPALGCRRTPDTSQDRADVEGVLSKYLRSVEAADVALASRVSLRSAGC